MINFVKILSIFFIASLVVPALGETKMLKAERTAAELGKAEPELARMAEMLKGKNPDEAIGILRESTIPEKLWTQIDEFGGIFYDHNATYYDVRVTYQASRERVGVAFEENGILEFHLNIPEKLQGQGVGTEIFKRAIGDYNPSKVKGWWKTSDIYTSGESTNLTIFKQKLSEGLSPQQAAFETPTGKILKANGFGGTVEIIKNTPDEVIIYFNPK